MLATRPLTTLRVLATAPVDAVLTRGARRVRERTPAYEDEGSDSTARGAVTLRRGDWWAASISMPAGAPRPADAGALLRLVRHGVDGREEGEVALMVRPDELDALVLLVGGVVAQGRRDGVLPPA